MTPALKSVPPRQAASQDHVRLDVRRRPAFDADAQTLPGARWRDPASVEAWAAELDRTRPLLVYCVHGHEVSQNTARQLQALGFDVRFLQGGIEAWRAAGLPLQGKDEG